MLGARRIAREEAPRARTTADLRGALHRAEGASAAIVMVGGAGGDVTGPAGIYEPLARRANADAVTALRLGYRYPNQLAECVEDVLDALAALAEEGVERAVLVGWSFGGAVVITAGALSDLVVGVATVATQSYGTDAAAALAPKSLLLLHGTADPVLPPYCSRYVYERASEPKELVLYEGDGHGLDRHPAEMLEKLYSWSRKLLLQESRELP